MGGVSKNLFNIVSGEEKSCNLCIKLVGVFFKKEITVKIKFKEKEEKGRIRCRDGVGFNLNLLHKRKHKERLGSMLS